MDNEEKEVELFSLALRKLVTLDINELTDFLYPCKVFDDSIQVDKMFDFINWMTEPLYNSGTRLSSAQPRCKPQAPDYTQYIVIDNKGRNVLPEGKFLTINELYTYYNEVQ